MLTSEQVAIVIIDMQIKLLPAMHQSHIVLDNVCRLVRGADKLNVPILHTEQNPAGLDSTVPEVAQHIHSSAIAKMSFSCCGEKAFLNALASLGRKHLVLAGIEAHVCVYQTAVDLLGEGYSVHIVSDAVASRAEENRQLALTKMVSAGAELTSVETFLFEILGRADKPQFKDILKIVR